jgi:hypothetical protein
MPKLRAVILLCLSVGPLPLLSQTCSNTTKTNTLVCSFPQLFGPGGLTLSNPNHFAHFASSSLTTFSPLSVSIGEELSTLPLGSAGSGVAFTYTPEHVPVPTEDSLGPIMTERAQVIGRNNLNVGAVYQYFTFGKIDGLDLRQFPAVLQHAKFLINGSLPDYANDYITTNNNVGLHLNQIVLYGIYGLTNRLDVSAEIPIEQVHLSITSNDNIVRTVACEMTATCTGGGADFGEYHYFGDPTTNAEALADVSATYTNGGDATGIGDVILRAKGEILKGEKMAASVGIAFRLPSGDANNFLGSGTFGVAPFGAFTYRARFSPHVRVGYQWNGSSILAGDPTGAGPAKASLPAAIIYSGGVDVRVVDRFTIAADLIGERVLDAQRVALGAYTDIAGTVLPNVPDIRPFVGDYSNDAVAAGAKVRLTRELLLTGNVTTRVDNGGLVARVVPLVGLSYAF